SQEVAVPESDLPVLLPDVEKNVDGKTAAEKNPSADQGDVGVSSPLSRFQNWKRCTCPKCGRLDGERETDTLDTFFDSSFYFLRFLDAKNHQKLCDIEKIEHFMPVDVYVGGREH
uniref:leucine--tRNA ligase n=1 Tax=Romanomermis culicivorax TaxID=13658 RepID=A0A915JI43_ROMCU